MLPLTFSFLLLLPIHFQSYVLTTVLYCCHIGYVLITNRASSKVLLIKRIKVDYYYHFVLPYYEGMRLNDVDDDYNYNYLILYLTQS